MTKNTQLYVLAAALVVIGGYFLFNSASRNAQTVDVQQGQQVQTEQQVAEGQNAQQATNGEGSADTHLVPPSEKVAAQGTVTLVDTKQSQVDGPLLITVKDTKGASVIVAVPARGLGLCAAKSSIADAFSVSAGDKVEVSGTRDESGRITPCNSKEDYFRKSASRKVVGSGVAPAMSPLFGTSWSWKETILLSGEHVQAPAGDRFVLSFGEDGHVKSSTDCNTMSGSYVVNGEVLSFGPMMSTMMFCEGSKEGVYGEALALTNSYTIKGSELHLNLNRDFGTMIFVKK